MKKEWIYDCYEKRQLLDAHKYLLKAPAKSPGPVTSPNKTPPMKRQGSAEVSLEGTLPDFFTGIKAVFYGEFPDMELRDLRRYVIAYGGAVLVDSLENISQVKFTYSNTYEPVTNGHNPRILSRRLGRNV